MAKFGMTADEFEAKLVMRQRSIQNGWVARGEVPSDEFVSRMFCRMTADQRATWRSEVASEILKISRKSSLQL